MTDDEHRRVDWQNAHKVSPLGAEWNHSVEWDDGRHQGNHRQKHHEDGGQDQQVQLDVQVVSFQIGEYQSVGKLHLKKINFLKTNLFEWIQWAVNVS